MTSLRVADLCVSMRVGFGDWDSRYEAWDDSPQELDNLWIGKVRSPNFKHAKHQIPNSSWDFRVVDIKAPFKVSMSPRPDFLPLAQD